MAYPDQEPTSSDFEKTPEATAAQLGDANKTWEERFAPDAEDRGSDADLFTERPADFDRDSGEAAFVAGDRIDEVAVGGWDSVQEPPEAVGVDDTHSAGQQAKQAASQASDRAKDVAGTAQDEAAAVKDKAVAAGSDVADTVTQQAGNVAGEVGQQSRRLLDEGKSELQTQASAGQQRLAELSRSLGGELQAMTRNSEQSGPMTDLVSNAQHLFDDTANWLERNEPADVLDSVRRYASRNPWQFLAISAAVGFVGARIVRGLQNKDESPERTPREVSAGYHDSRVGTSTSPVTEDPAYAGGPRYGSQERVQPGVTPGMNLEPEAGAGFGGQQFPPPGPTPYGDQRGL